MSMICKHVWVANSGRGGEPVFKINRQMHGSPIMHAKCSVCGDRTWFTVSQWAAVAMTPNR